MRGRIAEQRARERSALQEEEALRRLLDEQADLHSKLTTELDRGKIWVFFIYYFVQLFASSASL